MTDELERICKEAVMAWMKYYPSIYLEELKKSVENLNQDSLSLSQDSNAAPK
jgi:hypothetical protein